MKVVGDEFDFNHECWTTEKTFNEHDDDEMNPICAKYEAFNKLEIERIMLVDESDRYTVLKLP